MAVAGHSLKDWNQHPAFDPAQREGAVLCPALELVPNIREAVPVRVSIHPSEGAPAIPMHHSTDTASMDSSAPWQQQETDLHVNTLCSSTDKQ